MSADPLRVLIVDDSRLFRSAIEESLARRDDVKVVGSVWSGEKALELARASLPDFVTLDIEMPGLDGLETLKALRKLSSTRRQPVGVLLVSSYTKQGARVTIEGLHEGAFDFIAKPDSPDPRANAATLDRQLNEKLNAFRGSRARGHRLPEAKIPPTQALPATRPSRFRAIVIGASTGGPETLTRLLPVLAPLCPVPIYLVQHLPPDFTGYFATSLSRRCGFRVFEAKEGTIAQPGELHVAPGGRHLVLHTRAGAVATGISDAAPENGCRPAADVLFRSAAAAYAGNVLAVVLTGMGSDGAQGSIALKRTGAHVIVQDEASSVVWGMPGSTVAVGAAHEVLPLDQIAAAMLSRLGIGVLSNGA
jgi:two-component system chemotaxis response regulator CheB